MPATFLVLAALVTIVAAARSTWSPCGLSMLSAMTPLAEHGRGHRFGPTAAWFLRRRDRRWRDARRRRGSARGRHRRTRSLDGGRGVDRRGARSHVAASDARLAGFELPRHSRQVNEDWFGAYRRWVYASGFGWQIGVGLATYITTAAVYLTIAVAALTGEPLVALVLGVAFGFRARAGDLPRPATRHPGGGAGAAPPVPRVGAAEPVGHRRGADGPRRRVRGRSRAHLCWSWRPRAAAVAMVIQAKRSATEPALGEQPTAAPAGS